MRFIVSVLVSLLALSSPTSTSASSVHSGHLDSDSLSTVNRAGGWGEVSLSLEAGRFEDSHSHIWGAKAAAAAAATTAPTTKPATTTTTTTTKPLTGTTKPVTTTPAGETKTGETKTGEAVKPANHFTYDPFDLEAGPDKWAENFPTSQCAGTAQSPAPLPVYGQAKQDTFLKPLVPNYGDLPMNTLLLRNTGHALQVDIPTGLSLSGGALGKNPYQVIQLHMHARSEHSIGGLHYPMEIHIVHRDFTRDIATDPRALAVVGVMVRESLDGASNMGLEALTNLIPSFNTNLNGFGGNSTIRQTFSLNNLLPWNNMDYFHYNGSLTTPPCSEQVVWHVMTTPIAASRDQILKLTAPFGTVGNSRPTQRLNGRTVAVTSFQTVSPFAANIDPNTADQVPMNDNMNTAAKPFPIALVAGAAGGGVALLIASIIIYKTVQRRKTNTVVATTRV